MKSSPLFSVIMASYLEPYKNQASRPEEKIIRAVNSVLTQEDFELIIVADGCQKTIDIISKEFYGERRIRLFRGEQRELKKKRNAGGAGIPRNAGLQKAKGEYAIYLDTDDTYREDYLKDLKSAMTDKDWYWVDDLSWNKTTNKFDKHICDIHKQGRCGTSNVIHRLSINAFWSKSVTYLHDWMFINTLKAISDNYEKLDVVGYQICHVPNLLDV